jgi:diacylglycerol kinase (ATP)
MVFIKEYLGEKRKMEKKKVNDPLYKSFQHAFDGIIAAIGAERNMLIHIGVMCLVIVCGFIFDITVTEWVVCFAMFGLVISSELINTAIEMAIDICSPGLNPKAKFCKDVSAGAVLFNAVISVIVGLIIFIPYIL